MKYTVETTKRFDKAFALCRRRGYKMENLRTVIELLEENGSLPKQYRPHKLSGFKGGMTWECHIEPDWLLVYRVNDIELELFLFRRGSHADLF